jgi:Flp pilus assembly CpaF family ATPase
MTDRLPWPLEGLGLFTGNSHNILIAGPEGSGKTSNACTILAHLLSMDAEEKTDPRSSR